MTLAKLNQNFTMFAGDTETIQITVTDTNGNPLNLTGASIDWYLKNTRPVDAPTLIHKSTSDGITITDAINGVFQIKVSPADTSKLSGGTYFHSAKVTDSSGNVSTVTTGTVTIS